jgi:uncharacterized membrane protein (UPF0127 family)
MDRTRVAVVLVLASLGVGLVAILGVPGPGHGGPPSACANQTAAFDVDTGGDYDRTTVVLSDADGARLATVDVRIADTEAKRRTGLSETDALAAGEGMLFVHPDEGRHSYWMRGMAFPLDIVFATVEGEITTIHHAATPAELDGYGSFPGRGTYVLEVPRGYTNATGVGAGDCLVVPAAVSPQRG